jgi:hypothetical protein
MEKDLLLFFPCHQYRPELQKNPYGKGPDYREEFHEFLYIIIVTVIILRGGKLFVARCGTRKSGGALQILAGKRKTPREGA